MSKELREIFKTHRAEQNFGEYGMGRNTLESDLYLYCKQLESKLEEARKKEKTYEMIQHNYGELIKEKMQWKKTIQAVKDSLMSDEEIEKVSKITGSNDLNGEGIYDGIKYQRERTQKAIG